MSRLFLSAILMSVLAFACKTPSSTTVGSYEYFGEQFEPETTTNFDQLLVEMDQQDTIEAKILAKVESVCQAKGCWMNLATPDGENDNLIFVKFKDYGFFMPLDLAGNNVIVNGKAYKEETSVDELRHYAEDEGKSKEEIEAITEPVVEYKFMASGVALKKAE